MSREQFLVENYKFSETVRATMCWFLFSWRSIILGHSYAWPVSRIVSKTYTHMCRYKYYKKHKWCLHNLYITWPHWLWTFSQQVTFNCCSNRPSVTFKTLHSIAWLWSRLITFSQTHTTHMLSSLTLTPTLFSRQLC